MPIFDFICKACGQGFEYITRAGQEPTCPQCKSTTVEKQLSTFASRTTPLNESKGRTTGQALEQAGWFPVPGTRRRIKR